MGFKEIIQRNIIKFFLWFFSTCVKLRAKYGGQVSIVKDKILTYSPFLKKGPPPVLPELTETVGNFVLSQLKKSIDKNGDYNCLVNGYFSLTGKTTSCGQKTKCLSKIIKDSKLYAAAFWNAGLRKGMLIVFTDLCLQLKQ